MDEMLTKNEWDRIKQLFNKTHTQQPKPWNVYVVNENDEIIENYEWLPENLKDNK